MKTVTYQSVSDGVLRRQGIDPAEAQPTDRLQLQEFIASFVRKACEHYRWPVLLLIEERRYRAAWEATGYASGAEVYHADTDAYYQANEAVGGSDVPGTSTKWDLLETFNRYVAHEQAGQSVIGTVMHAWDDDPRANEDANEILPGPGGWTEASEGIRFAPNCPNTVWIEFRIPVLDFNFKEVWSETTVCAVGDQVYFAPDVYRTTSVTTASQSPVTAAGKFAKVPFPEVFAEAAKIAAFAETLTEEKQHATRQLYLAEAEERLDDQISILVKQQGQTGRYSVQR
jgi:hypothetical protein